MWDVGRMGRRGLLREIKWRKLKGECHLEDVGGDGKIILKWI